MNKFIFFLSFAFFISNLNAQNPINVIITGECSDVSGTYIYNGLVNGKNNYTKTFIIEGESIVVGVGFDNIKWVLYADGDLTDDGFRNIAVPSGLLPPFTGWVNTGCENGTMIIEEVLSIDELTNGQNNIIIYPNPFKTNITINHIENSIDNFTYKIFDLTGRIVENGKAKFNENINIESISNGNYIIEIETVSGLKMNKKLIKN